MHVEELPLINHAQCSIPRFSQRFLPNSHLITTEQKIKSQGNNRIRAYVSPSAKYFPMKGSARKLEQAGRLSLGGIDHTSLQFNVCGIFRGLF